VSKKPLLRSHSFTSLKSTTENFKIPSIDRVDKSSIIIPVKVNRSQKILTLKLTTQTLFLD
jgi:hypothetical protein